MDYDKTAIPEAYDAARGYSPEVMGRWLELFAEQTAAAGPVETILDLGCGTGRFSAALAGRFGARVVGLDPSERMLAEARAKDFGPDVAFCRADGEALPLGDGAVDLVFLSMAFHHLADRAAAVRECRRVLRPGGRVLLRNGTVDRLASYPYVGLFPGVEAVLQDRLVACQEITQVFKAAGFATTHHQVVSHPMAPTWAAYAEKAALKADSILAALSDEAFQAGMTALRAHAVAADPREVVTVNVDFFVFVWEGAE